MDGEASLAGMVIRVILQIPSPDQAMLSLRPGDAVSDPVMPGGAVFAAWGCTLHPCSVRISVQDLLPSLEKYL